MALGGYMSGLAAASPTFGDLGLGRKGDWMQGFTGSGEGAQFWPLDPRPSEINLRGIAHSLGMTCRYGGHCIRFYSVGEHSVHIAHWVLTNGGSAQEALWGLLHDSPESQGIADIIRPVKPHLVGYKEIEDSVMDAVCEWAGLPKQMPAIVKEADNRILNDEYAQNMERAPVPWSLPDYRPLGIKLAFWSPEAAERAWLDAYWAIIESGRL